MFCIIYQHVDVFNYSGIRIPTKLYDQAKLGYKDLCFMLEDNVFFRIYLIPYMDMIHHIYIRLFENRVYVNHSLNTGVLENVRQWKLEWK